MLNEKLVLVDDDEKSLKKVGDPINVDSGSGLDVVYDETAQYMPNRGANYANLYEDEDDDIDDTYYLEDLTKQQLSFYDRMDINLHGRNADGNVNGKGGLESFSNVVKNSTVNKDGVANVNKTCTTDVKLHDENVGQTPSNSTANPTKVKQVYKPKMNNVNTSGNKKKDVESTKEVSVLNSVENDVDLGINRGTSTTPIIDKKRLTRVDLRSKITSTTPNVAKIDKIERVIIDGKVTLVDDEGKPLEKIDSSGNYNSKDEVASVDNGMASFLASKKVSCGTNSLLEQWKETYEKAEYYYDPYDDDFSDLHPIREIKPLFKMIESPFNKLKKDKAEGKELDEKQLAFVADLGVADGQVAQTITHNAAFQTDDLVAYDFDCDDISSAKPFLMANLSSCDSDVLSETLSKHVKENKSLLTTLNGFEMEFKERESKSIEKEIVLENKNKGWENIVSESFGKRFVPQQELSAEQKFWLQSSDKNSEEPSTSNTPVKIKVPSELSKEVLSFEGTVVWLEATRISLDVSPSKTDYSISDYLVIKRVSSDQASFPSIVLPFIDLSKSAYFAWLTSKI
nr:hypothetical protein [Tanacetum cinerariifolium]